MQTEGLKGGGNSVPRVPVG